MVPFLVQFGLYASPVGFSSPIVPEKWQLLYALNPMVGVIEGFRWAIIGQGAFINPMGFWLSMAIVALLAITGAPVPAPGEALCRRDLSGRDPTDSHRGASIEASIASNDPA